MTPFYLNLYNLAKNKNDTIQTFIFDTNIYTSRANRISYLFTQPVTQASLNVILFKDINECVNHTCQNGGSCKDGVNNYSCNCLPGFTGNRCQTGRYKRFVFSRLFVLFNCRYCFCFVGLSRSM